MRFLITGLNGFAGRHLAALLLQRGDAVHGTVRRAGAGVARGDAAARPVPDERVHFVDVTDGGAVARVLEAVRPDGLFHLAGVTFVPDSDADPGATFRTNVLGTINVLAAVQRHCPSCRVLAVGSGDAYGLIEPADLPIREHCLFRPLSSYGSSKAAADLVAHQWAVGAGLDVVRVRPFNHTGPGQRRVFVCPDFASQLVDIEGGRRAPTLKVGNLAAVRDFSDVRDVVAGYAAAWETGVSGEAYNICSGVGRSVGEMLDVLIEMIGVSVEITVAEDRVRRAEVPAVVGSAEKLRAASGWTPVYEWRETLAAVLEDQRRVRGGH